MKTATEKKPVDLTRRRLAKGGLAAPVVLATLASKNALAAVPYQCTISGQMSGNTSPNGPTTNEPCPTGMSGSQWSATLTNEKNSPGARTLADLSLTSAYDLDDESSKDKSKDNIKININTPTIVAAGKNNNKSATVYEILKYGPGSPEPKNLDYAKKALVLYLNAKELNGLGSGQYPLTTAEAGAIFNAIVAGQGYSGTTSLGPFSWSDAQLRNYIDLLYH